MGEGQPGSAGRRGDSRSYRLFLSQRAYSQGNGRVGRSGFKNAEMEQSDFPVFNWDCTPHRLFQELSGGAYASGWVIGIGLLIVSDKAIKWISQKKKREYVAIITGIVLSGILIGFASLKTYPMEYVNGQLLVDPESMIHGAYKGAGGVLGLCLGWLLEMKLVKFETKKYAVEERLLRFLQGAVGLIIILKGCPAI